VVRKIIIYKTPSLFLSHTLSHTKREKEAALECASECVFLFLSAPAVIGIAQMKKSEAGGKCMHYITPYLVNITQSNDPPAVSLSHSFSAPSF
jgi:hypothetical protein